MVVVSHLGVFAVVESAIQHSREAGLVTEWRKVMRIRLSVIALCVLSLLVVGCKGKKAAPDEAAAAAKIIPAESVGVGHIDTKPFIDAAQKIVPLFAGMGGPKSADEVWTMAKKEAGIDVKKLGTVRFFVYKKDGGIIMPKAAVDLSKAKKKKAHEGVDMYKNEGFYFAVLGNHVVGADRRRTVKAAIEVFKGKKKGLADNKTLDAMVKEAKGMKKYATAHIAFDLTKKPFSEGMKAAPPEMAWVKGFQKVSIHLGWDKGIKIKAEGGNAVAAAAGLKALLKMAEGESKAIVAKLPDDAKKMADKVFKETKIEGKGKVLEVKVPLKPTKMVDKAPVIIPAVMAMVMAPPVPKAPTPAVPVPTPTPEKKAPEKKAPEKKAP